MFIFYFQVQYPLLLLILRISVTELLLVYAFKLFNVASQPATHDLTHNLQVVSMAPPPISSPVFGRRTALAQVPNSQLTGGNQPPEGADSGNSWGILDPGRTPSPVLYHPGSPPPAPYLFPHSSARPSAWCVSHGFLSWGNLGTWTKSLSNSEFLIPTLMSIDF